MSIRVLTRIIGSTRVGTSVITNVVGLKRQNRFTL